MVDLTDMEKKLIEAMKKVGATDESKLKDMDQIAKAAMIPKGNAANILTALVGKKVVKRVAREKSAGYYIMDKTV
jgi:hypothetical protein